MGCEEEGQEPETGGEIPRLPGEFLLHEDSRRKSYEVHFGSFIIFSCGRRNPVEFSTF